MAGGPFSIAVRSDVWVFARPRAGQPPAPLTLITGRTTALAVRRAIRVQQRAAHPRPSSTLEWSEAGQAGATSRHFGVKKRTWRGLRPQEPRGYLSQLKLAGIRRHNCTARTLQPRSMRQIPDPRLIQVRFLHTQRTPPPGGTLKWRALWCRVE